MSSTQPLRPRLPRRAEAALDRARLQVVPRRQRRAPRVPFVALVGLLLLGGVVGLLLFNTSMQQASFTAASLESQATALSARQEALVMDVDALRDPQDLARRACAQGMVAGPTSAFLDLGTGAVSGTPTAAVDAPCGLKPPKPKPPAAVPAPVDPVRLAGDSTGAPSAEPMRADR